MTDDAAAERRRRGAGAVSVILVAGTCLALSGGAAEAVDVEGPAATSRVSVSSAEAEADDHSSGATVSRRGRYVAFTSLATNLVDGDTNAAWDVFVRDRATGTTERVSVSDEGAQGDGPSGGDAAISANGRYVTFSSLASNLVPRDDNGESDVFVRDLVEGTTRRVSVGARGAQGNAGSWDATISADGRFVAFTSWASNLVRRDTNGEYDVFLRDLVRKTTRRVSVSSDGAQAEHRSQGSWEPAISADGRYVAFTSAASNLVRRDTNAKPDVFVRDLSARTTRRVSVGTEGAQARRPSGEPTISADGRFVAFTSWASNLVRRDTNGASDVFVRDRAREATRRVSVRSSGRERSARASSGAISADGSQVAFVWTWDEDSWSPAQVYVRDRSARTTRMVSVSRGVAPDGSSRGPAISGDGRYVAFESSSSNLVAGDTNRRNDVFLRDRGPR